MLLGQMGNPLLFRDMVPSARRVPGLTGTVRDQSATIFT